MAFSESQIIKGCQRGKKKYQYALVERYSSTLMTVCRRYVAEENTAKDLLQESLIRIFTNIDKYKSVGSFEAWLKTITKNCVLAWLKKSYVQKEQTSDATEDLDSSVEPEIYNYLNEEELINLIQELPTGYRAVFNMYVIEGYSHKEIAEFLNINESSSRSQLGRARKLLQEKISTMNVKTYRTK